MWKIAEKFSLLFLVLVIFICCKAAIVFIVPGILIFYFLKNEHASALFLKTIGCSLSFWMAAFWLLKYIPISLTDLFNVSVAITVTALFYLGIRRQNDYRPNIDRESIFFLLLLAYTAILRFLPLFSTIAPPGADMSMHTYMTALISANNSIPSSYFPIFNISEFSTFPVGFHTISALISHTIDLPSYRSTFILSCITYTLTTQGLYLLIRQNTSFNIAAVTAFFFTFLAAAPQSYVRWGGNPTIFSFVFVILFLNELLRLKDNQKYIVTAAFFLSGIFLTHTIVFVQSFWIIGISFTLYFILQKNKPAMATRLLSLVALFILIVSAYLLQIDFDIITTDIMNWIKNWVRNTHHAWHGSPSNCWWSVPYYILNQILDDNERSAIVVVFGIIGVYWQLKKKNHTQLVWLFSFLMMVAILIINTQYWILPFSYMIYPERTALFAIVPMALLFAAGLEFIVFKIKPFSTKHKSITIAGYCLVVFFLTIVPAVYNKKRFIHGVESNSSVSQDDMNAFAWLAKNTKKEDVTITNYGDAGIWIPSIIQRRVTSAHLNIMHLFSNRPFPEKPKFIFIGSKCVYKSDCNENHEKYFGHPDYDKVYQSNETYIYKLKDKPS
jgi:hypothetical protein